MSTRNQPQTVRPILRILAAIPASLGWTLAIVSSSNLYDAGWGEWLSFASVVVFSLTFTYAAVSGRVPRWLIPGRSR